MLDLTGISLPFSVGDLITAAFEFIGLFAPFILLGLAIVYTPRLVGMIRSSATSRRSKND